MIKNLQIPRAWKKTLLDKITIRGTGHTPNKKKPNYWNGGIKWVSLADSSKLDNRYISNTDKNISQKGIDNSSAVLHPAGTVILSRDAGVGKSAILAEPMTVSQHFIAWQCKADELVNIYLYYWLQLHKPEFERIAVGSTIKTIGLGYFKDLEITIPPIIEQYKIVEILSTCDQQIEKNLNIIKNMQSEYNELSKILMRKYASPNFSEPQWSGNLGMIGTTYNGLSGKKKEDFGIGKPFVNYLNVFLNSKIDINRVDLVKININEKQNRIQKGDIFFTVSSETAKEVGFTSVLLDETEETYLNSFCFGYRLHDFNTLLPEFARFLFRAPDFRKKIIKLGQGATRYNLSKDRVMDIQISLPSISKQKYLSDILSSYEKYIIHKITIVEKLKFLKQGLMQQLLTGKIRVRTTSNDQSN